MTTRNVHGPPRGKRTQQGHRRGVKVIVGFRYGACSDLSTQLLDCVTPASPAVPYGVGIRASDQIPFGRAFFDQGSVKLVRHSRGDRLGGHCAGHHLAAHWLLRQTPTVQRQQERAACENCHGGESSHAEKSSLRRPNRTGNGAVPRLDLMERIEMLRHAPHLLPSFIRAVEDVRGVRIVRLQGPVGMQLALEDREALEASAAAAGAFLRPLVFDFEATTEWDSSTIASLVQAMRRRLAAHAKVAIINASPRLLAELEISRLRDMFPIYPSEDEALAKLADRTNTSRSAP